MRVKGAHHVFLYGQALEQADILECPAHPQAGNLVLLDLRDVLSVQRHRTLVGRIHAGNHVEDRRLARAVGTDDAVDLARVRCQREILNGFHTAKALINVFYFQQRHQFSSFFKLSFRFSLRAERAMSRGVNSHSPSRPEGLKLMISSTNTA